MNRFLFVPATQILQAAWLVSVTFDQSSRFLA